MYVYNTYTYVYMLIVLFHVEHPTAKISGSRSIRTIAFARIGADCVAWIKKLPALSHASSSSSSSYAMLLASLSFVVPLPFFVFFVSFVSYLLEKSMPYKCEIRERNDRQLNPRISFPLLRRMILLTHVMKRRRLLAKHVLSKLNRVPVETISLYTVVQCRTAVIETVL